MDLTVIALLAAGAMAVLAVGMALVLGWANVAFHVEVDPRIEAAIGLLPAANCGGCGYVGCNDYAEAVVQKGEAVNKCTVGGSAVAADLGQLLGVEVEETWPFRAVVHCAATDADRLGRRLYTGEPTCAAANVISGIQGCTFGCLGLSDCDVACDYDAIHVVDGVAVVDYDKCTGCGACARACPRNIITMVPFKRERMLVVTCCNADKGKDVTSVCKVGCIGCSACTKLSGLFHMAGNLAQISYDDYGIDQADDAFAPVLDKCPRESLVFV
ncbi:MAG: RnfABCDGE type electron transport complex subunit B, partial [Gemmatimonadota bacterium]